MRMKRNGKTARRQATCRRGQAGPGGICARDFEGGRASQQAHCRAHVSCKLGGFPRECVWLPHSDDWQSSRRVVFLCSTQCADAEDRVSAAQADLLEAKLQHSSEKDSLWAEIRGFASQVQMSEEQRTMLSDAEVEREVRKLREDLNQTIGKNKILLDDFDFALEQRAALEVKS
jgi:hypothetical protein